MKIKHIDITHECLADLLRPDGRRIFSDFPKSAKILGVIPQPEERYGLIRLVVEDESFLTVAEGSIPEKMTVLFRREHL